MNYKNPFDGYISCGIIKSFSVRKNMDYYYLSNFPSDLPIELNKKEKEEILEKLKKEIDLNLYDVTIYNDEIYGRIKEDIYQNNVDDFTKELKKNLGMYDFLLRQNAVVNENFYNSNTNISYSLSSDYRVDVSCYVWAIDNEGKREGEDSAIICNLLRTFAKRIMKNKLKSCIYFGEFLF